MYDWKNNPLELLKSFINNSSAEIELIFQLDIRPSFELPTSIYLYHIDKNEYYSVHISGFGDHQIFRGDTNTLNSYCDKLLNTKIQLFPREDVFGLDGTTYKIYLSTGQNSCNFSWWERGPRDWENMIKLVEKILEKLKVELISSKKNCT